MSSFKACPALPHFFSTLSHERQNFRKNIYCTQNVCFDFFFLQILSQIFRIVKRNEREMIRTYFGLREKCRLLLSDFNEKWLFSTVFSENTGIKFHENPF